MNWVKRNFALLLVIALVVVYGIVATRAQTTQGLPSQETFTGTVAQCTLSPVTVPPSASLCKTGNGVWLSVNGGAYVQLGAAGTAGVISVNGKTGIVVLTGTTTSTTTIQ